jgi:hypothetical protein
VKGVQAKGASESVASACGMAHAVAMKSNYPSPLKSVTSWLLTILLFAFGLVACTKQPALGTPQLSEIEDKPQTKVVLHWSYPTDAATPAQFRVLRDGKPIATLDTSETQYVDASLWPDTRYEYEIEAIGDTNEVIGSEPVTVKTATPPLSDARLEGTFALDPVVRSSNLINVHPGKPLRSFKVSFQPTCKSGACGGRFTHYYVSVSKEFHAANHGTYEQRQESYLAELKGASMSWCAASGQTVLSTNDSAEYEIQVTDASVDKQGEWLATQIKGRDTEYYPFGTGCIGGHLTLDFEGQLANA